MAALLNPLLTEAAANLIIAQIEANFNAQLAIVDNQYTDGIGITALDNEHIYISNAFQTLKSPAVYVLMNEHAFQYSKNPNYLETWDNVIVVCSVNEVDAEKLTRKTWRYARVLFGVLNLASLSTPDGRLQINLIPRRLGYVTQPIKEKLGTKQQQFRMDAVLELEIKHFEKELF